LPYAPQPTNQDVQAYQTHRRYNGSVLKPVLPDGVLVPGRYRNLEKYYLKCGPGQRGRCTDSLQAGRSGGPELRKGEIFRTCPD